TDLAEEVPGRQEVSAGREASSRHVSAVSFQGSDLPAGPGVPEAHDPVEAGRSDDAAVRRPLGGKNRPVVPLQAMQASARARVPDADAPVLAGGHEQRTVRTERRGISSARMRLENERRRLDALSRSGEEVARHDTVLAVPDGRPDVREGDERIAVQ